MKKNYILVIDSGVGGVSILKKLTNKFPDESFIYLADNKIAPYGNKSKAFLTQNIIKIIENFTNKYLIKLIIFACNTLTSTSIKKVRKKFKNIKFVGTEPPVKMVNKNEKTLVLATSGTIKNSKLLKLYKKNTNFNFIALKNIAKLLDENFFDRKRIIESLKKQINIKNYQNVVLGCTHYYFLRNEIKFVLNNQNLKFFTSINGIIKRVDTVLDKSNKLERSIKIFLTKNDENLKQAILFLLNS